MSPFLDRRRTAGPDPSTGTLTAFLAVTALITLAFLFQGTRGIYSPDEGFYVGISASMARTGDYLIPRLGRLPWLDKPPMSFWGIACGLSLFGFNEWGARAFHAICFILTTLLVYLLSRALYGNRGAHLAGIIYATMILPFGAGNIVTPDTPLTLATTAAFYCFWRSLHADHRFARIWGALTGTALGCAFLAKGPAAMLPAAAMVAFLLLRGRFLPYLLGTGPIAGMLMFGVFGLGWYAFVTREIPSALEYFWNNQVVGRVMTRDLHRNPGLHGLLIYLPVLLAGTLPWSVAWWPSLWRARKRLFHSSPWKLLRDDPRRLFMAAWIGCPLVILLAARSRLPLYALPIFPALALSTSRLLLSRRRQRADEGEPVIAGRRIGYLALWCLALVTFKLGAAMVTSPRDMRALHDAMQEYLPQHEPYEIVSVREHLEGLEFYDGRIVERVTVSSRPYPYFIEPESLQAEVDELLPSRYSHVFVCRRDEDAARVMRTLDGSRVPFTEFHLPRGYRVFLAAPVHRDALTRLAFVGGARSGWDRSRRFSIDSAIRLVHAERPLEGVVIMGNLDGERLGDPSSAQPLESASPLQEVLAEGVPVYSVVDRDPGRAPRGGRPYFSKVVGGGLMELFVIDPELLCNRDGRIRRWLKRSLAESRSPWKVVASPGIVLTATSTTCPNDELGSILAGEEVTLLLQGSGPDYERSSSRSGMTRVSLFSGAAPEPSGGEGGAFLYDRTPVFVLLECRPEACHLAAFNALDQTVDEAILDRPDARITTRRRRDPVAVPDLLRRGVGETLLDRRTSEGTKEEPIRRGSTALVNTFDRDPVFEVSHQVVFVGRRGRS